MGLKHLSLILALEQIPRFLELSIFALIGPGIGQQRENRLWHNIGWDNEMDILFILFAKANKEIEVLNRTFGVINPIILLFSDTDGGGGGPDGQFIPVTQSHV